MKIFSHTHRLLLLGSFILILQAVLTHGLARVEYLPSPPPLDLFPRALGQWQGSQDGVVEREIYDMLGPDDLLNRTYSSRDFSDQINLFVAYYQTQHRARNAHDPKVCLPGAGWEPKLSEIIDITPEDGGDQFRANYYVVSRGNAEAVVIYWYQTYKRAVAREQVLKAYRVLDTALDNRTDMALVRIVASVDSGNLEEATSRAVRFVQLAYPLLLRQFPKNPEI